MASRGAFNIGRFLYHATSQEVGSKSDRLHVPSLSQPFFVTDNLDMAMYYVLEFDYTSVFIFTCDPKKLARSSWWIEDPKCMADLQKVLPQTAELFKTLGNKTLFDHTVWINDKTFNLFLKSDTVGLNTVKDKLKLALVNSLVELGLCKIEERRKRKVIVPDLKFFDLLENDDTKCRRMIKSKIFEKICRLGYQAVMDRDTTGHGFGGFEFGLFDIDLLGNAWSESVYAYKNAIKEIEKKMEDSDGSEGCQ